MKRLPTHSIALACGLALAGSALAQTASTPATPPDANAAFLGRTEARFGEFAGSSANAGSLATGLRNGTPITLKGSGETTTFTPPTKPMGNGNVTRSLDLAQRQLAAAGITDPTPTEIRTALMGGSIVRPDGTTTRFAGVLQLRSEGMGWGQIAHTIGVHPSMGKSAAGAVPVHGAAGPGVAAAGARSGIVTAAGARPGATYGKSASALGHVKVSAASPNANAAAGISTAAGAGASGSSTAASAKGQGNAFGRAK